MKQLRVIRTHTGHARFIDEVEGTETWLARCQTLDVPSPYRSSPVVPILEWRRSRKVVLFETSHKVFRVYEVPADLKRFDTEKAAEDFHIAVTSIGRSDTDWAKSRSSI